MTTTVYNIYFYIQGVQKIAYSTSGGDSGRKKKKKMLYKYRSGNKSFPSYNHLKVPSSSCILFLIGNYVFSLH